MHLRLMRARHLPALHVAHPPLGVPDAGVARGGADDGGAGAAPQQRMGHQPRQHLHGEILEGKRRPVKQLEQPARRPNLAERRDGRVMEAAIGFVEHGFEVIEARIALEIRTHDAVGGLLIIEPGEAFDLGGRKTRPRFRHIEPAVAGKTRKERPFEGKGLRFAPGAHITKSRPQGKGRGETRLSRIADGYWEDRASSLRPAANLRGFRISRPRGKRAPRSWRHRRTWTWSWR